MNVNALILSIRRMKDRDLLHQIIHAAEARDSKLSTIEGNKERARLWDKVMALGLKNGDMVFVHTEPRSSEKVVRERYTKPNGKPGWRKRKEVVTPSGQHSKLWGYPLTVHEVNVRAKELVVRVPRSTVDHRLSPFTCDKLKLSTVPSAKALANGLMEKITVKKPRPIHRNHW